MYIYCGLWLRPIKLSNTYSHHDIISDNIIKIPLLLLLQQCSFHLFSLPNGYNIYVCLSVCLSVCLLESVFYVFRNVHSYKILRIIVIVHLYIYVYSSISISISLWNSSIYPMEQSSSISFRSKLIVLVIVWDWIRRKLDSIFARSICFIYNNIFIRNIYIYLYID